MTTVPCPRCRMPVELEEEVCPHCRTPRDDMEMEEGRALVRNEELRRKRRPKLIAAGVAAVVLLTAAWALRGLMIDPLLVAWREFQIEVEKTRQPAHWIKDSALVPKAAGAEAFANSAPPVAVSSFVYLGTSGPAPANAADPPSNPAPGSEPSHQSAVPPISIPAIPPPPAIEFSVGPGEIHVHGTVYDLETKQPVGNVQVRFHQLRSGGRWAATTDERGRYAVGVYKNTSDPTTVMIEAPGYRKGLIEDRDPPYRERSASARADIIAETTDSDLEAVPLWYKESAESVELDLVLVPLVKK